MAPERFPVQIRRQLGPSPKCWDLKDPGQSRIKPYPKAQPSPERQGPKRSRPAPDQAVPEGTAIPGAAGIRTILEKIEKDPSPHPQVVYGLRINRTRRHSIPGSGRDQDNSRKIRKSPSPHPIGGNCAPDQAIPKGTASPAPAGTGIILENFEKNPPPTRVASAGQKVPPTP
jgi:hypothetical protein